MSLWPTRKQWARWSLPSKLTAVGALVGVVALGVTLAIWLLSPAPATDANQAKILSGQRETRESLGDLKASVLAELKELKEGSRRNVRGLQLPAQFDPEKLDRLYPLGWAFFFGYGSRLVAEETSFRRIEIVEWPDMQIMFQGAMFSGGDIRHKLVGGRLSDNAVLVPGSGRWSPYQLFDTCAWFEVLRRKEERVLGVVGFAPASQILPGITLFSPACRG